MGRLYDLEDYNDISIAFHKKAVEINPHNRASERLEQKNLCFLPFTRILLLPIPQ